MRIVRSIDDYHADADLLLSIGVFDGVHAGHRAVLANLAAHRGSNGRTAALTFERHPQAFLHPENAPKCLTTTAEKINLLDTCGIDVLFLLTFDARIAEIPAESFLRDVLLRKLRTKRLVVGDNWRFGKGASGDVALAKQVMEAGGAAFEAADLVEIDSDKVSSSRIRALIEARRFADADRLLASEFAVRGVVELGDGRGHELGFPTANLAVPPDKVVPPDGVYGATARINGADHPVLVSIGSKPTFGGTANAFEVHVPGFDRSIYGETVAVRRFAFAREQERFDTAADLVAQMRRDAASVRKT
jgi:riboflavin kinase/FMN adenylyltransferase